MTNSRNLSLIVGLFSLLVLNETVTAAEHEVTFPSRNESLRISRQQLPALKREAEAGNVTAALRLANYYGVFLNGGEKRNRDKQIHYYELAAASESQAAIESLVFIYSMSRDRYDLSQACHWRRQLKRLAAQQNIRIQSDAEWYYDLYSEYFVARRSVSSARDKKLGLQFLRCAARLGLKEAERELAEICSDKAKLQEEGNEGKPCICGELSVH